ncbi:C2 domain-containing protein 3 [Octopus bimaculoides]|uniref:C2 domain-containing protein 3 n=1 Tax=Octopus bimaculoides TaxID=37653 RepID=UPI00071C953D|nr:C2 domain-containing protein 3 [Octopus bimaculoides]|eukprot:XP_014783135.1 PREDICTED: C2 domain-containing protein 3-like [Octopus bimaculoides]
MSGTSLSCHVPVSTALPPQVEGHLRCFLCLCIPRIEWLVPDHPARTLVHLTWWGEIGSGTNFRPLDVSNPIKTRLKTTARYPIRSGPKQFASYLNDMNLLLLDIVDEDNSEVVGYTEVTNITSLTVSNTLENVYPVLSLKDVKIAELHVSIELQPLMESYDSTGFVPTPDIVDPQPAGPVALTNITYPPSHLLASSERESSSVFSNNRNFPRTSEVTAGLDLQPRGIDAASRSQYQECGTTVSITTAGDVVHTQNFPILKTKSTSSPHLAQQPGTSILDDHHAADPGYTDIISILLEKGHKLRKTMIHSLAHEPSRNQRRQVLNSKSNLSRSSSCGSLFQEILAEQNFNSDPENSEERIMDLVLGPDHDAIAMSNLSLSSQSSLEIHNSDISDPVHQEDILQELLYTDACDPEFLCENQHPPNLNPHTDPRQDKASRTILPIFTSDCPFFFHLLLQTLL